jgi:hypothetical protein
MPRGTGAGNSNFLCEAQVMEIADKRKVIS